MHIGALKKLALALTFWLALHTSALKAQIFTNDLPLQAVTTGTNPVDFEFRADGTLIAKGNIGVGSLLTGDQGDGTRMLWFAGLGAFRAGAVTSGYGTWDSANIGQYSVAFGINTTASGYASVAMGIGSIAADAATVAIGQGAKAWTQGSTAMGSYSGAVGYSATGMGYNSVAWGGGSTAIGNGANAYGSGSLALGYNTNASGDISTASGSYTIATAYNSFVIGTYNIGGGNSTDWITTDPLFEIGNGTSSTPADALVVYKNGNAVLQGTLQVSPGGDIPMYTGE